MTEVLTKKDFQSDQTVRWCPGCGDYAILTAVQNALPQLGRKKEEFVFVSGIGCSSRFPYYMETYGFHTIHGRAPGIATGIKVTNPSLDVWLVSGDGDTYSIGGNHFIHTVRRNVGLKYLIFNNEIYGLTKGQFSPTSGKNLVTKSSPFGNIENRFNPMSLAIGAGCTFYARVTDTSPKEMTEVFIEAAKHKGTAVVEILQNCVIFNDKVHASVTAREVRDDHQLKLVHGEKMLFGKERNKGIVFEGNKLKVVTVGENGITEDQIVVHDQTDLPLAFQLSQLQLPDAPLPMGILRCVKAPTYEDAVNGQIQDLQAKFGKSNLQTLLTGHTTWRVT